MSWIVKDIMEKIRQKNNFEEIIVIDQNNELGDTYVHLANEIYSSYDPQIIKKVIYTQTENIRKGIRKNVTLVLNNCMEQSQNSSWINDESVRDIFFNGRQYNISCVMTTSTPDRIPPDLRSNIDYVMMTDDEILNQKLYSQYAGIFPNFNIFKHVYKQLLSNDSPMVISNVGAARIYLFERLFYYHQTKSDDMLINIESGIESDYSDSECNNNDNECVVFPDVNKCYFKQFEINNMVNNPAIAIIGKRESGKSWIVRNIVYNMYQKDNSEEFVVISPTDKMNCFYGKFIDKVYYSYNSNIIEYVLAMQTDRMSRGIIKNVTVVLDDCLSLKGSWMRDIAIQEMLYNGKHYHITYILTMQFPLGITPELRSNFDYVILLNDGYISNLKRMYDHYAGMFPTFSSFKQTFSQLTSDYNAMTICNRGARSSLFDKISYFHSDGSMGSDFKLKSLDLDSDFSEETLDSPKSGYTTPVTPPVPFGNDFGNDNDHAVELDNKINVIDKLLDCNKMMLCHLKNSNYTNKVNLMNKMMDYNDIILNML